MPATLVERTLAEIRAGGGRVTPARRAVLAAVLDDGGHHFTAAEIFAAVDDARPRPDRATVYRTLDLLTELGVVTPLQLDGDATVYHRADHRHGHLVCTGCGAIVELPEAARQLLAESLEDETGFVVDTGRGRDHGLVPRVRGEGRLMHELALCQAIVDTVTRHADGHRVERVEVRIGHFRQVVPDSLLFSWDLLVDGTELSGCTLAIDHVPAVVECHACGETTTLDLPILVCSTCGGTDVELVSGQEFLVASIDRAKEVC